MSTPTVLVVTASANRETSSSRALTQRLLNRLVEKYGAFNQIERDLNDLDLPFLTQEHLAAFFTPAADRSARQKDLLALSDDLVADLQRADIVVIASPIYNFSVPAKLKAWIDLIARAGVTFRYTENGPVGLLENKQAYLVLASGGTRVGSPIDFAGDYLRHILGFIGISDVTTIAADGQNVEKDSLSRAEQVIDALVFSGPAVTDAA